MKPGSWLMLALMAGGGLATSAYAQKGMGQPDGDACAHGLGVACWQTAQRYRCEAT
jgi:hypothetical protein